MSRSNIKYLALLGQAVLRSELRGVAKVNLFLMVLLLILTALGALTNLVSILALAVRPEIPIESPRFSFVLFGFFFLMFLCVIIVAVDYHRAGEVRGHRFRGFRRRDS